MRPRCRYRDHNGGSDGLLPVPHGRRRYRQGFRPILVREVVGDRVSGVPEWNLFDIGAKYGDVESTDCVGISRGH